MPSESDRQSLPFEPKRNRKKSDKKSSPQSSKSQSSKSQASKSPAQQGDKAAKSTKPSKQKAATSSKSSSNRSSPSSSNSPDETRIPEAVSQRMIRRMALFSGLPTSLGVLTFFVSYFIVVRDIFPLPNAAVVLVSMGFFGLGVIGLSYGVLSASWEADRRGDLLGWSEFKVNFSRMVDAWRSARKQQS